MKEDPLGIKLLNQRNYPKEGGNINTEYWIMITVKEGIISTGYWVENHGKGHSIPKQGYESYSTGEEQKLRPKSA